MGIRLWYAKLRYPMPEEGDFIEDLPLDEHKKSDGDDRLVGIKPDPPVSRKKGKEAMSYAFVPLVRQLHYGLKGRDVTAVQLALRHAGFRPKPPTGRYGIVTRREVNALKTHHGIKAEAGYGEKAHKALWPSFGPVAHHIYKTVYDEQRTVNTIQKVVNVALFGYTQRAVIHYTQDARRMEDFGPPPNVPNYTDCSGFATWCFKSGGASDPNGFGYNGYGFTGTMLENGHEVALANVGKADLVFYGHPVSHVALAVGNGRVVSHGNEDGPELVDMWYWSAINCARRYIQR